MNDYRDLRILSQGEIEELIARICDEMDAETHRYADVEEAAANAEADYKRDWATALLNISAETAGMGRNDRPTGAEREAAADARATEAYRAFRIMDASRRASKESLLSLRARLDALRTLSANVRSLT